MAPDSTELLSELDQLIRDDELFSEFLTCITHKKFRALLSRIDDTLETKFASCMRRFIQDILENHITDPSSGFRSQVRSDLCCTDESHIIVHEMDCFPDMQSFKGFSGFIKSIEYVNNSGTEKMRLASLLPFGVRTTNFISNGHVPLDPTKTALNQNLCVQNEPLVKIQTFEKCALCLNMTSSQRCDVLICIIRSDRVIACSRLSQNGQVKLVSVLQGGHEYQIHVYSTLKGHQHTVSVGVLSGAHTCKILN